MIKSLNPTDAEINKFRRDSEKLFERIDSVKNELRNANAELNVIGRQIGENKNEKEYRKRMYADTLRGLNSERQTILREIRTFDERARPARVAVPRPARAPARASMFERVHGRLPSFGPR
jgi:septal ring factor EnvC (AmiA/AmiB activator)